MVRMGSIELGKQESPYSWHGSGVSLRLLGLMSGWQRSGIGDCEGTKNEQCKAVFGATQ
jgi:hypothetical protein